MYEAFGFIWMQDQTVLIHTNGTASGITVNGANQTGYALAVNALSGTLNAGDIITIAGVDGVNKITKQDTGILKQFVVTQNVASGATSIPIYPAIIPPTVNAGVTSQSQYQTVTAAPANGAAVTQLLGAGTQYRKNFAFCKEAVTLATADLELPGGVHEAARETFDGISMRMITQYVIGTDQLATRLDILYGYLWIRPEWACIVPDVPAGL